MALFKNLVNRVTGKGNATPGKKDEQQTTQQQAQPAPVPAPTPEPVITPDPVPTPAPAPAPVPSTKASDDIRRALETAAMKLITSPEPTAQDIGKRLMSLKTAVSDQPSPYKGFDASITKAIGQIEFFVGNCGGDYTEVLSQLSTLEAAVFARYLTEESTDKFVPTMQTHLYQVMLIDLRGRLKKLDIATEEKTIWRDKIMALPPQEQFPHMQALMTCNGYLNAAVMQRNVLESYISNYEFAYSSAVQMLSFDGELPPMDVEQLFDGIMSQTTAFEQSFEQNQRSLIDFNTKFSAKAEAQLVATAKAEAAARQQQQQQQQIFAMQEASAKNLAHLTGQPNPIIAPQTQAPAPVAQPQQAAPAAAAAASEGEMQTM